MVSGAMPPTGSSSVPAGSTASRAAVMRERRSVRAYLPERIPDSVLEACFDLHTRMLLSNPKHSSSKESI